MHDAVMTIHTYCSQTYRPHTQLSEGQEVYAGPAAEAAAHFEALGHACPANYNPAEFYADLISVDPSSPEAERQSRYTL